ncbi:MAG: Asp-tRNA(Asn)/Glu-tRNA(Gln) amidotransferase subunit GatB [Nitrospirae bacterium]|nr:Asp-tRNA(Asn)/Glu-tRNA(Gln) amidotransferase subunit GatB [Nitrospirota bacterium]
MSIKEKYEVVIGLEVHAQLLTKSKIFCGCSTKFGASPNTQVCPVCLGLPGVLPVLNKEVVNFAMMMAIAANCTITPYSRFARKNYFYPDLPKGYQISQYELPLAVGGHADISVNNEVKRIGITRIHLEEDAGKSIHDGGGDTSLVDLNRAGVPLIEIVSEPDIRTSEEAVEYLKKLREIVRYLEICDGNMEEGSFRCDANVSIRPVGEKALGTKAEIKNMNSFRFVMKALEYEIERQIDVVENGGRVIQETRLWDSDRGVTVSMRSKEEAHDYRYFPEPDLVPVEVSEEWKEEVRKRLPELPDDKRNRFISNYEIPDYDAMVLTSSRALADFFEEAVSCYRKPKVISNWVMGDLLRDLKLSGAEVEQSPVKPGQIASMVKMIDDGIISGKIAKTVFEEMYKSGKDPDVIVKEQGLVQITDESAIEGIVDKVIAENPKEAEAFRGGKDKLMGFFVGQVMKLSGGKANPAAVNQIIKRRLGSVNSEQ